MVVDDLRIETRYPLFLTCAGRYVPLRREQLEFGDRTAVDKELVCVMQIDQRPEQLVFGEVLGNREDEILAPSPEAGQGRERAGEHVLPGQIVDRRDEHTCACGPHAERCRERN